MSLELKDMNQGELIISLEVELGGKEIVGVQDSFYL